MTKFGMILNTLFINGLAAWPVFLHFVDPTRSEGRLRDPFGVLLCSFKMSVYNALKIFFFEPVLNFMCKFLNWFITFLYTL